MFICTECKAEYKVKPDFCDCGNDVFEEIKEAKIIFQDSILKQNLPSIIFLIFCIILSFIILFFIGNPKNEPQKTQQEQKQEKNIVMPDIDDIWNDEKPKQQIIKKPEIQPKKEEIAKVESKKEPEKINKSTIINKPKKPQQTISKPQITAKAQINKQTQTAQPVKQPIVKQSKQTQPVVKQSQQPQTQTQPTVTQSQSQPQTQPQKQPQNIKTTTVEQINPEELKQYKKALRNKIASNIDFLSVAGDGKCSLSFSISSSGTLLNRKFVSQSQNTSLNDAVYAAMLQVSSFKAPPKTYKNETMKLTVQISGGNFSVSLE